jgi:hypothetical protein
MPLERCTAVSNKSKKNLPPMDDLTAIAFAREAFDKFFPVETQPIWLRRYSSESWSRDSEKNFVVGFAWQPKSSTRGAERFFEVVVNAWNATTKVVLATPLDKYTQDELEEYM